MWHNKKETNRLSHNAVDLCVHCYLVKDGQQPQKMLLVQFLRSFHFHG